RVRSRRAVRSGRRRPTAATHRGGHPMNDNTVLWRCRECGDVMPAKYQRTHPVLCAVASALCAEDVERAIQHFTERGRTDDTEERGRDPTRAARADRLRRLPARGPHPPPPPGV